ncbi:type II secretion system F family protein [Diaminobutyricimonas sp. LJ205]|uniref:type II secretion system F family protein n=1 Tax=Diaminobutyricimonas sp. LJ205 TaxID=2683590 RepID=UPI0012F4EE59|nr:type II secretion system F family protein [Diaminobutyricimonas sp. LJ205]
MSGMYGWALLCGLGLGLGLWLVVSVMPRIGRPRLIDRVAPYLVDVSEGARQRVIRRTADPLPVFGMLLAPVASAGRRLLSSVLGGTELIETRLRQSASPLSVEGYRSRQLAWLVGGAGSGIALAALAAQTHVAPPVSAAIIALAAASGVLTRDQLLRRAADRRLARLRSELPTTLEFLTLSLSAGEGVLDALHRVARVSRGELAAEFGRVLAEVNTGVPIAEALRTMGDQLRFPPLIRVVEQMTGALDRGTPLAEVLRAQARDARDESKRELLETAGKKEVAMLVPVVFLILPVTVAFAIYPGIAVLQLGF